MSRRDEILAEIARSQALQKVVAEKIAVEQAQPAAVPPLIAEAPMVPQDVPQLAPVPAANVPPPVPPTGTPENDPGFFSNLGKGGKLGGKDLKRQQEILSTLLAGGIPEPQPVEEAPELGWNRKAIGQFIGRSGVGSVPSILGGAGGAIAGGAAGSAVPLVGTVAGGLTGAATGSGAFAAAQSFADAYNEARLAGQDHEQAIEYAGKVAKISGGLTGLATLLGGVGLKDALIKQAVKQVPIQAAVGQVENTARNALAKSEEVDPNRGLTQGWKEAAAGPAIFQTAQSLLTKPIVNKKGVPKAEVAPPPENITPISKPEKPRVRVNAEGQVIEPVTPVPVAEKPRGTINEKGEFVPKKAPTREEINKIENKIFEAAETPPVEKTYMDQAKELARKNLSQTGIFDRYTPLKKLGKEATGAARESENTPYRMARFSDHMTGVLEAAFEHGTPHWNANEKVMTLAPESKGLKTILAPIFSNPQKFKDFQTYAYARRVGTQELLAKGKEKNITLAEVGKALDLGDVHPEFKQVFDEYQKYNSSILDIMEQTGLINNKQRATWQDMDYIPFYREMPQLETGAGKSKGGTASSLAGQKPNIHELTGGKKRYAVLDKDGNIVSRTYDENLAQSKAAKLEGATVESVGAPTKDIVENLFKNTGDILPRAMRNAAAVENIRLGQEAGLVEPVAPTAMRDRFGNLKGDIVSAYIDGQQKFFKVNDPLLYSALTSAIQGPSKMGPVMKGMNLAKNLFSRGVLLDPSVALGIAVKDLTLAQMMGKDPMPGFIQSVKNYGKGVGHEFGRPDPRAVEIMAMGGDSTFHRVNPEQMMKRVEADIRKADGTLLGKDYLKHGKNALNFVDKVTRGFELANRLNKYDAAKKAGRTNPEAVFEALDYMDYQMRGSGDMIPFLTNTVPFMASHLQGFHKLGREMKHNKGWNRTNKMLGTVAAFSAANAFMNNLPDEDEESAANGYDAQPDYLKDSSIMIDWYKYLGKDATKKAGLPRWALIPKPWEIGFLSMTVPEHAIGQMMKDKHWKEEGKDIASVLMHQLSINPIGNPLVKTSIEQWADKQFFMGNSIVPRNREGVEPRLQYGPKTTEAAKSLGDIANVSPARIEHAIRGVFGLVGMYPLMMADLLTGKSGGADADKPLPEKYIANKFMKGDVAERSNYENEMYELWKASEEAARTYKVYEKAGEEELMKKYGEKKAPELARRKEINRTKKDVKELNDEVLKIRSDKSLSSAQKKEQINTILRQRNLLLKQMHDKYSGNKVAQPTQEPPEESME